MNFSEEFDKLLISSVLVVLRTRWMLAVVTSSVIIPERCCLMDCANPDECFWNATTHSIKNG